MQITFNPATVKDAKMLVAFERKVADQKIYGPPLDLQGAIKEIEKSTFYFIKEGDSIVGTVAYRVISDGTVYISNVAVAPEFRRRGVPRTAILFILQNAVVQAYGRESSPFGLPGSPQLCVGSLKIHRNFRQEPLISIGMPFSLLTVS
jgi:hypothetical protein